MFHVNLLSKKTQLRNNFQITTFPQNELITPIALFIEINLLPVFKTQQSIYIYSEETVITIQYLWYTLDHINSRQMWIK